MGILDGLISGVGKVLLILLLAGGCLGLALLGLIAVAVVTLQIAP